MLYIIYMGIGAFAGLLGGLLGIGGGLVMVPLLSFIFTGFAFPSTEIPRLAVGTSHATIIFVSLSAVYAQYKKQAIDYGIFIQSLPAILIGTFAGSYLIAFAPALVLHSIFCVVLAIGIIFLFYNIQRTGVSENTICSMFIPLSAISALSSSAGIGGGGLFTAYFLWCGISIQKSVALSIALIVPISLSTTIYTILAESTIPYTLGYMYLPAVACMVLPAIVFAQVGVRIGGRLPQKKLRTLLSFFLLAMGIYMVYKSFTI